MATVSEIVAAYRQYREKKKALASEQKAVMKTLDDKLEAMENWLGLQLQINGAESMRTDNGTVYTTHTSRVKIVDWETAQAYIESSGNLHMYERKLSAKAVEEFVDETHQDFPGTQFSKQANIRVKK